MARLVSTLPPPRRTRQAAAASYPRESGGAKAAKAPNPARSNTDLWRWYLTPEVWAVANRIAAGVRRVAFFPAVNEGDGVPGDRCPPLINPDGTTAEGIDARLARDAAAVWATVRSPLGGQSDLFGMEAVCLAVAGDALQFGYPAAPDLTFDPAGDPVWVAFARTALTERAGMYEVDVGAESKIKVPPQSEGQPGGRIVRVWDPDPRAPASATVWTQAVRDPLAHLTMIYEAVAACALSRLNAGVILAPDNQDRKGGPGGLGAIAVEEDQAVATLGAPLYRRLVDLFADHVELSQLEQDGFSRAVPVALGLDKDLIDSVKWLQLAHDLDPELGERISDLRQRVLLASPLPIEVVSGMANLSGLGGGSVADRIGEDEYQKAIVPVCERISGSNTTHVLRATLLLMNHDQAAVERVRVGYSADELLMKPDRSEQAIALAKLDVPAITPDELRDATGLGELEGPDAETQLRMLAERLLVARGADFLHLLPFLGLPEAPVHEHLEPGPAEPAAVEARAAAAIEATAVEVGADTAPGDTSVGEALARIATRYEDRLAVLFAAVVAQMLKRSASRVAALSRAAAWSDLRPLLADAPTDLLGVVPGVNTRLAAAEVDDDDLFGGALATFAADFDHLTADAQRRAVRAAGGAWDDDDPDAEHARAAAWALGGRLLISEARRRFDGTLADEPGGEGGLAGFGIPALLVRRVSAVAGGSTDVAEGRVGGSPATAALASVATGVLARRALASSGRTVLGYLWDYDVGGDRARPYPPHQELHGAFSTDVDDFDGYYVGDHDGCLCQSVMVLAPLTEEVAA